MTEATAIPKPSPVKTTPTIHYQVAMPQPESHLFEVTLKVTHWQASALDLKMPVWTPGSYLVREYAKQVQDFQVHCSESGKALVSSKLSKNHWQIETSDRAEITVSYRVFANELSVRTNHLDTTHGYFNGAALFFFIPGYEQQQLVIEIIPPYQNWQVTTTLNSIEGKKNTYIAPDFDTLVDSPFEIGTQQIYDFEVLGKPHQLAIWGHGNAKVQQIIADTKKIIEVEAEIFDGLPYQRYLFLLHLSASGYGGLEHKDSCSLNYPRFGFRKQEKYHRFIQLVAHEFFHLWNVKRIRPQALEKFDYEQENYTTSLWFCEGTTSYYDLLIPCWAGLYDRKTFLEAISKDITRLQTTPGRKVQPVSESGFDAWIKLYRRDANSDNNQISYYLKGEMVSLLLDLLIRAQSQNQRSLDDIMRQMWQRFGMEEVGFTPQQLKDVIESVAQQDLTEFFQCYVDGTQELPFNEYLEPFGLELQPVKEEEATPYLGMRLDNKDKSKATVRFVEANAPAEAAGIDSGDELLALEGMRVSADDLEERLKDFAVGDEVNLTLFHGDELKTCQVKLGQPQPSRYQVVQVEKPSPSQKALLAGWFRSK